MSDPIVSALAEVASTWPASKITTHGALHEAMVRISKLGLGKTKYNQMQKYWYRGIDDLYNLLSGVFADVGLCCVPNVDDVIMTEYVASSERQTKFNHALVKVTYRLMANGASFSDGITVRVAGEGMDTGDKAVAKAMSMAYKTFAVQTFCIPIVGDDDADDDGRGADHSDAPLKEPRAAEGSGGVSREAGDGAGKAPPVGPGEIAWTRRKMIDKGKTAADLAQFGIEDVAKMTAEQFKAVRAWLQ